MDNTIVRVDHLSKMYHKGVLGYNTIREQMAYRWANLRRKEDPNSKLGGKDKRDSEAFWALDDISFEVARGETFGIIGNNGSGKSTLLKILSQITAPTRGTVEIVGKVASLLEVGTGFHPEMTGRENVYLNGAILGMTRAEINLKFDDIVDYSGIGEFIDTPVKRYSSGMYVRLAFSVAAHLDSDIVILDEVLAVGDAQFQKKCLDTMEHISHDSGRTVLFVSHAAGSVKKLCKRCLWLDEGRMVKIGDATDVVNEYAGSEDMTFCYRTDWPNEKSAPQNSAVRLLSVFICNDRLEQQEHLSTDDTFYICCKYMAKEQGARVGLSFVFFDAFGTQVFATINNKDEDYGVPLSEGKCRYALCKIPGGLLNNGVFSMGISYYRLGYKEAFFTGTALTFEVSDGKELRGDFQARFDGIFRPALQWTTLDEE